jgi:tetratricopeptide (TPR) repeat protein
MPLLSELREFKASFANVGGQKANLAAKKIPFNDLDLPETEAQPMPKMAAAEPAADTDGDLGGGGGIGDFDFSDLISAHPGDLAVPDSTPDIDAMPEAGAGEEISAAEIPTADDTATPSADDLYFPDELLSNLSNDLEPILPADSSASDNGSGLDNLDNLENFSFPASDAEQAPEIADAPLTEDAEGALDLSVFDDLGDLGNLAASPSVAASDSQTPDLGASSDSETLDLDDLGDLTAGSDLDLPETPPAASDSETTDFGDMGDLAASSDLTDLTDISGLGDLDLPDAPPAASDDEAIEFDDMPDMADSETPDSGDMGDAFGDLSLPEEPAVASDSETLDMGDFGDLSLPEEPAAASDGETPNLDDLGDFGISEEPAADGADAPNLDDLGDFGIPEEPASAETPDLDALGDFGLPEEPAAVAGAETPNLDDLGDFGLPEEPPTESEAPKAKGKASKKEPAPSSDSDMPEIGELDDLETPEFGIFDEPVAGDETTDMDDTTLPDEEEEEPEEEIPGMNLGNLDEQVSIEDLVETADDDAFVSFDPAGGIGLEKEGGEPGADSIDSIEDFDDMSFPDLDAITGTVTEKKAPDTKKGKGRRRKKKEEIEISDDINEIELNPNELRYIQETLTEYPLNLRIACEEIIAEKDIRPEQMARLLRNLIRGAPARETALLASEILDRPIVVPRGFEKSSGEALEAERSSFTYIFIHSFLPMLRLFTLVAIVAASAFYLTYKFIYIPLKAESIYKMGYERIPEGEYQRANERFDEAFNIHRKKIWFFKYADAFIQERQYIYAEQKYDELLRYYPRDKLGVLVYAQLETQYLRNYAKADSLLRHQILDYNPNDIEALLALGDNSLAWAEIDPSKYEDARFSYARLRDLCGEIPPVMERMLKYFIRTDNLKEVLPIWQWFNYDTKKRPLGADTLSELGGYLLDKQLEEVKGVPNEYVALIDDVREILLRAVQQNPALPEPHYHLARYYKNLGNAHEERVTLEIALRSFDNAREESLRRLNYHIDAYQRYADNLIDSREFLHAEEQLQQGIKLYDDAIARRLLSPSPQYGRLYAGLGDLEYFVKTGDMGAVLRYYNIAQQNGWAPPEMQYRMGVAHYQLGNWQSALEYFFAASTKLPLNRRILFSLGNAALRRGDNFAAQGYYTRLLSILENQRARLPLLLPNDRPEYLDLAERLMMARNNAGVANEKLAAQTGSRAYHTRAMSLYSESQSAWDSLTRDPTSMVRSGSTPLPFLNMRNILYPRQNYEPQIFTRIDREAEASRWEQLAPPFRD